MNAFVGQIALILVTDRGDDNGYTFGLNGIFAVNTQNRLNPEMRRIEFDTPTVSYRSRGTAGRLSPCRAKRTHCVCAGQCADYAHNTSITEPSFGAAHQIDPDDCPGNAG